MRSSELEAGRTCGWGSQADTQHLALNSRPVFGGVSKCINSAAAEFPGGSTQGNLTGIGSSAEAESTAVSSLRHSHLSYCPALPDNQKGDT